MGQAVCKLKPPSRPVSPSESAIPKAQRQAGCTKPVPLEPQIIFEPDMAGGGNCPDPNFVSMSQQIIGTIITRPPGQKEHSIATIKEYTRPMPADRHTTLLTGPDEDSIQSPGTLNHAHIREVFLLHRGRAARQEPMDVESLATKFNVDGGLLRRILHYNALVYYEKPAQSKTALVPDSVMHEVKNTVQQFKGS